jgi:hypothetical protein
MEDQFSGSSLLSYHKKHKSFEDQIKRIKKASEIAQDKIDYYMAHNESVLQAIEVVENFLRKKHRICYGGQAINAHLPDKHKFYDPERTVPDYDFFSPNPELDIRVLVQDLKRAGFTEISAREGMHEGTVKIYVEYIPVADITAIDPVLYRILSKREYRVNGISYMDVNTLRMMMYLELSRPRGEVDRWPKVYERLLLLNTYSSTHRSRFCKRSLSSSSSSLSKQKVELILDFCIRKQRVFAGLDLVNVYQQSYRRKSKNIEWLVHTRKPILFYSPEPESDAEMLRENLERADRQPVRYQIKKESKTGGGELLPTLTILYLDNQPIVFIIHQTACHSYFQLPMKRDHHQTLRIASVDTLITLYFSLALMNSSYLDMGSMDCLANQLIEISNQMRSRPDHSPFPFISINCAGHQTSITSLIRAKVKRMTERKARLKKVLNTNQSLQTYRKTVKKTDKRNKRN